MRRLGIGLGLTFLRGGGASDPTTSLTVEFVDASGGTLPHRVTCGAQDANLAIGDTEHTFTGLDFNTEYTVNVYAVDGEVESLALTVDVFTAPQYSPSGLTAEAQSESEIMLTWTDPVDPPASTGGGIEVWVSSNGTDFTLLEGLVTHGTETYAHTGLTETTQRWYKLRAFNDNPSPHDDSYAAFTDVANATTDADEVAPTVVSATVDGDQLVVTFSEPVGTGVDGESGFAVDIDWGTQNISATFDSLDGTDMIATFTLATPIAFGDVVTLQYTQPGDGWQDLSVAANKLASFSGTAVTNNTADAGVEPDDIAGLQYWFKADAIVGLNDGDPVATWEDSSTNNRDATEATNRPIYKTGIINGLPVVRFDGSNDKLIATVPADASKTIFVVAKQQATNGNFVAVMSQKNGDAAIYAQSGTWYYYKPVISIGSGSGSASILCAVFTDISTLNCYLNGGSAVNGNPDDGYSSGTSCILGVSDSAGNAAGNFDIAEVICYDTALGTTDREAIRGYLADKYAITL